MFGWTIQRGEDINWDLQNYHLYDAYALLHGHLNADVAPGGPQSFLNPLPYLLPYLLRRALPPIMAGLLVTATQIPSVMLIWAITCRALAGQPGRAWVAGIGALGACTGAVVLTETGTSFCDVVLSAPALLGLFLLLPAFDRSIRSRSLRLIAAGASVGIAIGLKPTGLFLFPALTAASIAANPAETTLTNQVRTLVLVGLGTLLGAMLSDGIWAFVMWRDYASPMFPFLNTIFRSPNAAVATFGDPRYHWQGIGHALLLPFDLAYGSLAAGEIVMRDARLALALPIAFIVVMHRLFRRSGLQPVDPLMVMSLWLLLGTGFWLLLCPIQRYAASLEMLAVAILVVGVVRLDVAHWRVPVSFAALLVLVLTTRPADLFHRSWVSSFTPRVPAGVPFGATYGLLYQPEGYWATLVPRPTHSFTLMPDLIDHGGALKGRLDDIIQHAGDRLQLLDFDTELDLSIRVEMSRHGITLAAPCLRTPSMIWLDTAFCHGRYVGPRAYAASDLQVNDPIRFSSRGAGLIYEISGWYATDPDLTWAVSQNAILAFHPSPETIELGPMTLTFLITGIAGAPPHRITAQAGSGAPAHWMLDGTGPRTLSVCVGPERIEGGVVLVHLDSDDNRSLKELHIGLEPRTLAFGLYEMSLHQARSGDCALSRRRSP